MVQATIAVTKGAYGNLLGYETARMFGVDPVAQILGEKPRSKQVTFEQPVKQSLETSQTVPEKLFNNLIFPFKYNLSSRNMELRRSSSKLK